MRKTIEWYLSNEEWIGSVTGAAYQEWVTTNYADRKNQADQKSRAGQKLQAEES